MILYNVFAYSLYEILIKISILGIATRISFLSIIFIIGLINSLECSYAPISAIISSLNIDLILSYSFIKHVMELKVIKPKLDY